MLSCFITCLNDIAAAFKFRPDNRLLGDTSDSGILSDRNIPSGITDPCHLYNQIECIDLGIQLALCLSPTPIFAFSPISQSSAMMAFSIYSPFR